MTDGVQKPGAHLSHSALPRRGHLIALLALTAGCGSAGAAISQPSLPLLPTTALPGMAVTERTLSAGRTGYVIEVAPCGCHRETPIVVALVSRGDRVSWLYGTGPGVRPATLRSLLARAP